MRFVKMHGIGNDYVYVDAFTDPAPERRPELALQPQTPENLREARWQGAHS